MKEKQYIRFIELSGISITRKEYEGVKLFMEIEELIQETEKAFCSLKEIISDYSAREEDFIKAMVDIAEPREKRIAELEAQIEKMKCCGNCAKRGHICVAEEIQGKLCGKNKDKWELWR